MGVGSTRAWKEETELLMAAQSQSLRTDAIKAKIDNSQNDSLCRMCLQKDEIVETFSITFFMGNRKMSRDHGLAVTFAVCSSRLNRRKGFQR